MFSSNTALPTSSTSQQAAACDADRSGSDWLSNWLKSQEASSSTGKLMDEGAAVGAVTMNSRFIHLVRSSLLAGLLAVLLTLPGCFLWGSGSFEFPDGLEPIEDNLVPKRDLKPGDPVPKELDVLYDGAGDFSWAHGRGWLETSMSKMWEILQEPEIFINHREVDEWSITTGVEEGYDGSWRTHNVVKNPLATVAFQQTYRMGVVSGTHDKPEVIMVRAELTEADNPFMEAVRDSVIISELFDGVVEVEYIRHRQSLMNSPDGSLEYPQDLHSAFQAVIKGKPIPNSK